MMQIRTFFSTYLVVVLGLCCLSLAAKADETRFFTIGTGSTAGTYFPVGSLIASAISRPAGSSPCDEGGACGVDNLIATAVTSRGSIDNIEGIGDRRYDSGLVQSDIVAWAYGGEAIFEARGALPSLRAIATLYPEHVHLVARRDIGIRTIADLKGRRVAVDRIGSGTRVNSLLIMGAYGIERSDFQVISAGPEAAISALLDDRADAAFFVVGYPSSAVSELLETGQFDLIAISGAAAEQLSSTNRYYTTGLIPGEVYGLSGDLRTVSVGAQWVTHADVSEQLIYDITAALWRFENQALLRSGHPKARSMNVINAVQGISIPFHPGAERYYREQGVLK